ncbi:hypothetical protein A2U01_0099458, partial [Trifolium medium]|nr:hypothetical protein [Trifolium medium]
LQVLRAVARWRLASFLMVARRGGGELVASCRQLMADFLLLGR